MLIVLLALQAQPLSVPRVVNPAPDGWERTSDIRCRLSPKLESASDPATLPFPERWEVRISGTEADVFITDEFLPEAAIKRFERSPFGITATVETRSETRWRTASYWLNPDENGNKVMRAEYAFMPIGEGTSEVGEAEGLCGVVRERSNRK